MDPAPRWRPGGRFIVLAVFGLVVLYVALSGLRLLQATRHLQTGVRSVAQVRSELSTADLTGSRATPALRVAVDQFTEAHREIHSAWLAPLHIVPYVGRQVDAVDALSSAAATVTGLGQQTLAQVRTLLQSPHGTSGQRAELVGRLAKVITNLNVKVDRVSLGPSNALLPPIASRRNTFARDLTKLRVGLAKGTGAASAVADLLDGHQTYLVFTGNNAEMRDGSGMFLQAGTVTTDDGQLTLGSFQPTAELASSTPLTDLTGDLKARWGALEPNYDYRNLGLSPQFALNAPVAARMWKTQTGHSVDGVLTLDVAALKDLLAVTGPVSAGGATITRANVEHYLFVTQYRGITEDPSTSVTRREVLGQLAQAIFTAVQDGHVSLPHLATALADGVDGRHILAWSSDPSTEADWQAAGAGGTLAPADLLLGTINKGANKLDPYEQVTVQLSVTPVGKDTKVTVRATQKNDPPASLPAYAAGGTAENSPPDWYTGALALDLPKYAGKVEATGGTDVVAIGSDGPSNVLAKGIRIPPGGSTTVTWTFLLLGRHGTLRVDPSARVPPVTWSTPGRAFTDATAHLFSW